MGRKSFHIVVLAALVVLLLAVQPAPAGYNMLQNGSFETATVDPGGGELILPVGSTAIAPWVRQARGLLCRWFLAGLPGGSQYRPEKWWHFPELYTCSGKHVSSFLRPGWRPDAPSRHKISDNISPTGVDFSQTKGFSFDATGRTVTNMGWTTTQWNLWGSLPLRSPRLLGFGSGNTDPSQGGPALDNVVLVPVSAILQNGSFETADPSLSSVLAITVPNGSTAIYGWMVGGLGIQLINTANVWDASQGGAYSLNLNSPSGPGSISQTFTTIPGDLYQVSFDMAGDPGGGPAMKTLRVTAAGQSQDFTFDTTGKSTRNMGWVTQNWTFRANATRTTLAFQSLDNGANGPALDNVRVVHPANLVLNGSFEDGPRRAGQFTFLSLAYGDSSIIGWTVAGNGIDYIEGLWTSSNGGFSLDLNALDAGSIEQTFLTTPGATYNVSFDLAGNLLGPPAVKTLRVSAAGQSQVFTFDTTGKSPTNLGWTTQHFAFTAKWETTTLLFESLTTGTDAGPALDNVRVTGVPPLQGPYLLLLLD